MAANRASFVLDPRVRARLDLPDHYAPGPALRGSSSPMSSTAGRKRERSPDDGNLDALKASRLPLKRVRIDLSEDGEIAEDGPEPAGRPFASKDSNHAVAVREKSPGKTLSDREERVGSVPQQRRSAVQTSNGNPLPSDPAAASSRPASLPEPRPAARGLQILQPQQTSWKSLLSRNVPLERLSNLLPSLPTKDQASILHPLRRGESVVVYGRDSE